MTSGERFKEIDIWRGIGIVLVVLGHALKQTGESNWLFDIIISVIYSFHMPLFFLLAGMVSVGMLAVSSWNEKIQYIKARAIRLLIPYFFIGILYMPLKYYLSQYAIQPYDFSEAWKILIGDNPNTALWFLYVLFVISAICILFVNDRNLPVFWGIGVVVSLLTYSLDMDLRILKYFFFFISGICIRRYYDGWMNICRKKSMLLISAAIFALSNIAIYRLSLTIISFEAALSGILLCMSLSLLLADREGCICRMLEMAGKNSMDIYIFSEPLNTMVKLVTWNIMGLPYLACTACCFIFALTFPVPISKRVIRRIRLLRILLLGSP